VNSSEPTKKVTPIAGRGDAAHCAATEASRKQMEPSANPGAIQRVACGADLRCARER
jgi:hypothetical protein